MLGIIRAHRFARRLAYRFARTGDCHERLLNRLMGDRFGKVGKGVAKKRLDFRECLGSAFTRGIELDEFPVACSSHDFRIFFQTRLGSENPLVG